MNQRRDRHIRIRDTLEPGWQDDDIEMIGFVGNDATTNEEMIVIADRDQAHEIQSVLDEGRRVMATTPWHRYMRKIDGEQP